MKRLWTLLVFLTFVSVSFARNVSQENGDALVTLPPEADQVDAKELPAAGAGKQDQEKAQFFNTVMVVVVTVVPALLICAVVIKALRAPNDKGGATPKGRPRCSKASMDKGHRGGNTGEVSGRSLNQ